MEQNQISALIYRWRCLGSNPVKAETWFKISPHRCPSQLSYNDHNDRTPSVSRWDGDGEDWPSALICRG